MKAILIIIFGIALMFTAALCGCANQIGQQPSIGGVNSGGQAIVTQATGSAWPALVQFGIIAAASVVIVWLIIRRFRKINISAERKIGNKT